jgi:hypothetical protein
MKRHAGTQQTARRMEYFMAIHVETTVTGRFISLFFDFSVVPTLLWIPKTLTLPVTKTVSD